MFVLLFLYMFLCAFEYVFLVAVLDFKKEEENWLVTYCSNFFQNSPCIAHLHRDLSTQLSAAPVNLPSSSFSKAGKVTELQRVPARVLPCLPCVQMDLLLHVRWKEELQDITSGGVSPHTAFPT